MSREPCGTVDAFAAFDHLDEPVGELDATTLNSDDDEIVRAAVELDDLHRHALQGALDGPGVEDRRGFSSHSYTNMARSRSDLKALLPSKGFFPTLAQPIFRSPTRVYERSPALDSPLPGARAREVLMFDAKLLRRSIAAAGVLFGVTAGAQARDMQAVARNLVQAGMVKQGDKVLINGSVRDAALLEDIAVETMKVGAHPLVTLGSERLFRRSFDEVPARFDNVTSPVGMLLVNNFDVQINLDVGENEAILAGVPMTRRTARNKAGEPVTNAFFKRNIRSVNLGNGLYPTATLSRRLRRQSVGSGRRFLAGLCGDSRVTQSESERASSDSCEGASGNSHRSQRNELRVQR